MPFRAVTSAQLVNGASDRRAVPGFGIGALDFFKLQIFSEIGPKTWLAAADALTVSAPVSPTVGAQESRPALALSLQRARLAH